MFKEFIILLISALSFYLLRLVKNRSPTTNFIFFRPFIFTTEWFPSSRWFNYSTSHLSQKKFEFFEQFGSEVVEFQSFSGELQVIVASAEATKFVFDNKIFGKPIDDYAVLSFFGLNLVITEGAEWKKHRKLTAPAFSEKNNESVWDNSVRLIEEWFVLLEKKEENGLCFEKDSTTMTLRLALMVISSAGFGINSSWNANDKSGEKLSFIDLIQGVLDGLIIKLLLPNWMYKLPFESPRHTQLCFQGLESTLKEMILTRREQKAAEVEHSDLFSRLLGDSGIQGESLTEEELIGNTFLFLLAGHETTAHTLAFAFTLLALYPQHQHLIAQEVSTAFGDRESTYSDYNSLPYTLAIVMETLRMYPIVPFIPRIALIDTVLPTKDLNLGRELVLREIFIRKGSRVAISVPGLHYNPEYYDSPYEFNPSRFIDTETYKWNRDAFVAFAGGPRRCIGQKFSLVETVAVLSHLCKNYEILIPSHLKEIYSLGIGESEKTRRERVFAGCYQKLTMTPPKLPLVFKKRTL